MGDVVSKSKRVRINKEQKKAGCCYHRS